MGMRLTAGNGNGNGNGNGDGYGDGYGYGNGNGYGLGYSVEIEGDRMAIGCQSHALTYWIEHGLRLAKENDINDIAAGLLLHHIKKLAA